MNVTKIQVTAVLLLGAILSATAWGQEFTYSKEELVKTWEATWILAIRRQKISNEGALGRFTLAHCVVIRRPGFRGNTKP